MRGSGHLDVIRALFRNVGRLLGAVMTEEPFRDVRQGRRQSPRRAFRYPAQVVSPDAIQWDGIIIDISASGAQLEFISTTGIPDRFSLLIASPRSPVERVCEVVWRSDDRLGVRFLKDS